MSISASFDYEKAFSRNSGLLSKAEQTRLRSSRVAICGIGGVGGGHALVLARLGVGRFRLIDPDTFDIANFNRQVGANISTIGRPKAKVIAEMIHEINPEAEVDAIEAPLDENNVDAFLSEVDLFLDGIDFFATKVRMMAYRKAREYGISVLGSGPIGMSATMHVFTPQGMPFETYYGITDTMPKIDLMAAFLVGDAVALSHRHYMVMTQGAFSYQQEFGPSLGATCMICSGVIGVEAMRVLLGRPGLKPAPHWYHFDAYLRRFYKGYIWLGGRNPWQRFKRRMAKRMLEKLITT